MSKRHGKTPFVNGSILVISFLISLGLAELLAAIFAPSTIVANDILGRKIANADREEGIFQSESGNVYFDWRPNQRGTVKWLDYEYEYAINSLSLRDSRNQFEERSSYRILVIGDSQTYGWGLNQDETFTSLVEIMLNKSIGPIEVYNAGVRGYGTHEMYWKLQRIVPIIRPNLIIVTVFVDNVLFPDEGNDLWQNWVRTESPSNSSKSKGENAAFISILAKHSHLYHVLANFKNLVLGNPGNIETLVRLIKEGESDNPKIKSAWDSTRNILKLIGRFSRNEVSASTVVLYVPGIASLVANDSSATGELIASGLPVLSVFHALRNAAAGDYSKLRWAHDSHYNVFAHNVIAQSLASQIVDFLAKSRLRLRSEPNILR